MKSSDGNYRLFSPSRLVVFRAGEQGYNWYAVLGGQLEVRYHAAADSDTKVSLMTLFTYQHPTNKL
jgi:hypothetical protein